MLRPPSVLGRTAPRRQVKIMVHAMVLLCPVTLPAGMGRRRKELQLDMSYDRTVMSYELMSVGFLDL